MRIPIVNEQDEVIGYKDRYDRNLVDITRTTGLWVTDEQGNILLAQRALDKKHSPGLWGPAVAGTVEEGETYESNIIKEADEELGLKNIKPILGTKFLRETSHKYFSQWFTLIIPRDTILKVEVREVAQIKWFTKDELDNVLKENPEMFLRDFEKTIKYL